MAAGILDRSGKVIGCVMMFAYGQALLVAVASERKRATR
jgi:hypothetical protein